jgi:ABC-2 type transport system permease protein
MLNSVILYLKFAGINIRSQMQYRASFVMVATGNFVIQFIEFIGISVLFSRFGTLKGWNVAEIALFYGIINISFAVALGAGRGFDSFATQVVSGEFDRALLRPRTTFLQVLAREFRFIRVGRVLVGLVVLVWGVQNLAVAWSLPKAALLLASVFGGVMLFLGLLVIQASWCFWSTQSLEVMNSFTDGGVETARWPISIYSDWLIKTFVFIIPLACVNYFPLIAILERPDVLHSPEWLRWVSPLAGALFLLASLILWEFGVRHYKSTGS